MSQFRSGIGARFKEIVNKYGDKYHRIKLWVEDETRIGLMPIHRKRISLKGLRPQISSQIKREYEYLYGLIEPQTGNSFMLELPNLEGVLMEFFMAEFSRRDSESLHLVMLDNASAHTTEKIKVSENIIFIFFPPNAPELNPIERFWKELKDWLSDYEPETMAEVRQLVTEGLKSFTQEVISSVTSFEYLMTAWKETIA